MAVSQDAIRLRFGMTKATATCLTNPPHDILRNFTRHTQACIEFIQILHTLACFVQLVGGACHQDAYEQEMASMARITE